MKERNATHRIIRLRTNAIYRPKEQLEEDVFAYIRVCRPNEIGFSVKDTAEQYPDFSECGVFWLAPDDFDDFFEEC